MQVSSNNNKSNHKIQWAKFAGLASQWAIVLAVLVYVGKYLDLKWTFFKHQPVFIWVFPFVFILISLFSIVKETKNDIE